jgi:PIN domain nuclease of toxin-antitoxin system
MIQLWNLFLAAEGTAQLRPCVPDPPSRFVPETCVRLDVEIMPIHLDVAVGAATLPLHHRDPFDRILVATALREGLTLLSCDERLDAYGVQRLWE